MEIRYHIKCGLLEHWMIGHTVLQNSEKIGLLAFISERYYSFRVSLCRWGTLTVRIT